VTIRIGLDAWYPAQHGIGYAGTEGLARGVIVILKREPYRVVETREVDPANWPGAYLEKWTEAGCPDTATWRYRPIILVLRDERDDTAKALHVQCPASTTWRTLPEHYFVCRRCGEIPPCREVHNERIAEQAAERFEERMAIMPGCCHSCREPITSRQKFHRFTGPNLIRPDLGDDSAIFHLRGSCRSGRDAYDKRWAEAAPGRRRSFYCNGSVAHHHDGTSSCSNPECPSAEVRHRSAEWHRPGVYGMGCSCVSGDLTARMQDASDKEEG
jgi:hypothetical protein